MQDDARVRVTVRDLPPFEPRLFGTSVSAVIALLMEGLGLGSTPYPSSQEEVLRLKQAAEEPSFKQMALLVFETFTGDDLEDREILHIVTGSLDWVIAQVFEAMEMVQKEVGTDLLWTHNWIRLIHWVADLRQIPYEPLEILNVEMRAFIAMNMNKMF